MNDESLAFLDGLESFIEEFQIRVISPPNDSSMLLDAIRKYKLLPSDAVIVASCKHHGITKMATLDSDFRRVDFLDLIEA